MEIIDMKKFITKNGKIDSIQLRKITEKDTADIVAKTKFLQLDPTISQRLKTIFYSSVESHPKCVCGNYLPFSKKAGEVFVNFCSISCAKKTLQNKEIGNKFKNTLNEKKFLIEQDYKNATLLSKEETKEFFIKNFDIFRNGGSKGINFLNKNVNYKKSLEEFTTERKLTGKIYELIYGKGECEICNSPTNFVSLETGYKKYCYQHGKGIASKNKGLNNIKLAIEKIESFQNYNDFSILKVPEKLNDFFLLHHKKCGENFELWLHNGKLQNYVLRCSNCCNKSISSPEHEIRNWLKDNGIDYIPQYKINSKKIDIVIPSKNLAIEYNGLNDHSFGKSKYTRFNNAAIENKNNHLERTILCNSEGLKLMHIFENEWINKTSKEIWKSIISTNLGINERIYARKCEIKEIRDNNLIKSFLDENHLQGYCSSKIKIGLFYNSELVSLMTFGNPRFSKKYEWELVRFCNKINLSVVGGASKMFNYFIKKYFPNNIISYCDIRVFSGGLYESLGFQLSHNSEPNYFYVKGNKIYPRYQCQKHKLKNILSNFDPNKTEKENMFDNGYRRIWDCGNKVYMWNKN